MNDKLISIYKYHIITSNEEQMENLEQVKQFAAFNNRIENEMLNVKWLNPLGDYELDIFIKDIVRIEYLGMEIVALDTEMNRGSDES